MTRAVGVMLRQVHQVFRRFVYIEQAACFALRLFRHYPEHPSGKSQLGTAADGHTISMEQDESLVPASAQENIDAVIKLEEKALQQRLYRTGLSDVIANFVGSIPFVVLHLIWFGVWYFSTSVQ